MKGAQAFTEGKSSSYLIVIKVGEALYYVVFDGEGKFEGVRKG
jgi:hypothetical protein